MDDESLIVSQPGVYTVNAATYNNPVQDWLRDALTPNRGDAGVPVTAETVRGLPPAWYSICKIAGHVGALPLNLYERQADGDSEAATTHPAYWIIKHRPSPLCTASVFRETIQHHAILHGNGRAAIIRNGRGEPDELLVMQPKQWAIVLTQPQDASIPQRKYHVRVDRPDVFLPDADVLHVMGLSDDGISGIGVIDAAKQALGLAIAQQRQAATATRNGNKVKFLLQAPPGVFTKADEALEFITKFNEYHSDPENADRAGLLRNGITAQSISQSNQEAQAIESRKFSRQDIGLLMQVEQMLGDDSSVSYNSMEMKNQAYLTNCLMRWLVRWQEECAVKLLTPAQFNSERYYFRFVTAALLRGTTKERYEVYQIARQMEVMNANEVRQLEDMNKRQDPRGNEYANPAINTVNKVAPRPEPESDDSPDPRETPEPQPANRAAVDARLSSLVRAHVGNLVAVERSRIEQAAGKEDNFCDWHDGFYVTWCGKMANAIGECGATDAQQLAATWCADSSTRILSVAGAVDKRGLSEAIRAETATWSHRVDNLVETITRG